MTAATNRTPAAGLPFASVFAAFAGAYFLSYLYRTVNAVISPDLVRDLGLAQGSLGLLTSVYLLAFGLAQVPAGMLLDRYGPRRVEPVLLAVAALGSIAFGLSESLSSLVVARALIGLGVSVCLMAPLKAIATWYPPDRQASIAGWMMVAGGLGALSATAPLQAALSVMAWRTIFLVLGGITLAAAAWLVLRVPDIHSAPGARGFAAQFAGVRAVFAHPRYWWIAPLAGLGMGAFMAVQGLWAIPWMIDVEGLERTTAARQLLVMGVVILGGYVAMGLFATRLAGRGIHARHLFFAGFALNTVAFCAIVLRVPGHWLWWSLYGLGASVNVLAFPVLNGGFEKALAARANTALNLVMFGCSFLTQWGIGLTVDAVRDGFGLDKAAGLRVAFAWVLVLDLCALAWFVVGWRRHAAALPAAQPA